jgi:hypothetical protein
LAVIETKEGFMRRRGKAGAVRTQNGGVMNRLRASAIGVAGASVIAGLILGGQVAGAETGGASPVRGAPAALVAPGSCAADPNAAGCPPVSEVVTTDSVEAALAGEECTADCPDDPEETGYAPVPGKVGDPNICHVKASRPSISLDPRSATTLARNYCEPGYGVAYMEIHGSLHKLTGAGYWDLKDRDVDRKAGHGWVDVRAEQRCDNRNNHYWRSTALAYTVIEPGVGYTGSNQKFHFLDCGA